MGAKKKEKESKTRTIDQLLSEWGDVYPGAGAHLKIKDVVLVNLPLVVSVFGLLGHAYNCGQIRFHQGQDEEIVTAMETLLKLCSAVGITPQEWDETSARLTTMQAMENLPKMMEPTEFSA